MRGALVASIYGKTLELPKEIVSKRAAATLMSTDIERYLKILRAAFVFCSDFMEDRFRNAQRTRGMGQPGRGHRRHISTTAADRLHNDRSGCRRDRYVEIETSLSPGITL